MFVILEMNLLCLSCCKVSDELVIYIVVAASLISGLGNRRVEEGEMAESVDISL